MEAGATRVSGPSLCAPPRPRELRATSGAAPGTTGRRRRARRRPTRYTSTRSRRWWRRTSTGRARTSGRSRL
uniref:Uncharacterized protein n=1 Tax=Arundo donax TaxID=35708 RepID=A0A0A9CX69_ARUDO